MRARVPAPAAFVLGVASLVVSVTARSGAAIVISLSLSVAGVLIFCAWVLSAEDRTRRLERLIRVLQGQQVRPVKPATRPLKPRRRPIETAPMPIETAPMPRDPDPIAIEPAGPIEPEVIAVEPVSRPIEPAADPIEPGPESVTFGPME